LKKLLIYGYGNPGRQDDALGVELADQVEAWSVKQGLKFADFETNYQLNIEDALLASEYESVIFADASTEDIPDFKLTKVESNPKIEFTMHAVSPAFILHLCQSLYNKFPQVFLLHIKGYEFDFLAPMSKNAEENLEKANNCVMDLLAEGSSPHDFGKRAEFNC
jgi:hydrogenase maturation protease